MESDNSYRDYSDNNFNKNLNKYEFSSNSSDKKKINVHQEPHQLFLRNFVSKSTPFESVLLYHQVGTGKTCSSISISEGFKEYINNMGRKIFVLVKNKNIQNNFMDELLSKCTGEEYLNKEEFRLLYSNESSFEKKNKIRTKAKKIILKSYEFITYGVFVNRVLGAKSFEKNQFGQITERVIRVNGEIKRKMIKDPIKTLNNTVIIVDEAHNITNNDNYVALMTILKRSYNYRLVLLTATPIYDNPTEIFELSNLLNASNPNLQLPSRKQLFEQSTYVNKIQSRYINESALKGGIIKVTDFGKQQLMKSLYGKVSYLQSNIETNPKMINMGEPLIISNGKSRLGTTKVIYCQMSDYQYEIYIKALYQDIKQDYNPDDVANIVSEENIVENETQISKTSGLYKKSNDASTMVYPNNLFSEVGFRLIESDPAYKSVFTTDLKKYSNKLYTLLQNLKSRPGKSFVYSNYVSFGGTTLVKYMLQANGFYEYRGRSTKDYYNFVVFDQNTSIEKRERYKLVFNSIENKTGKLIKILLGSPIVSEGVTLKAVRQVHILEPSWNMSKINQIIGRAVRNYSHSELPVEDRTVEIYKYVSVYTSDKPVDKIHSFFIDKERYILSEEKDRSNKEIEHLLKQNSFDCVLNTNRNKIINGIDGSAECDYTKCDYNCVINTDIGSVDYSTYNLNISFFEEFDITFVTNLIKDLFKNYIVWSLDDIVSFIHNVSKNISIEVIYTTLNNIVDNKVNVIDQYDRSGFIINKGPYYIFNSSDIDINSSIYSKTLDFSIEKQRYTLNEFAKMKLNINILDKQQTQSPLEKQMDELYIASSSTDLSQQDIDFNENIEKTNKIYGTFRIKKTKQDKWPHKYGKITDDFKIVYDIDGPTIDDKRKLITGKYIGSFKISELVNIANELNIDTKRIQNIDKKAWADIIQKYLVNNNKILR